MNDGHTPLRIVKVGGSLLDWPQLPRALHYWLAEQQPARSILICGGGPFTDFIGHADRAFSLGEEASHWLCIDALSVAARMLAAMLTDLPLVVTYPELQNSFGAPRGTFIFDPRSFLRDQESQLPGNVLPRTWSATTDSIAARLAEVLHADELNLLKSAEPPRDCSLTHMAAAGYVDSHFPIAAEGLSSVRFINLRSNFLTADPSIPPKAGRC